MTLSYSMYVFLSAKVIEIYSDGYGSMFGTLNLTIMYRRSVFVCSIAVFNILMTFNLYNLPKNAFC